MCVCVWGGGWQQLLNPQNDVSKFTTNPFLHQRNVVHAKHVRISHMDRTRHALRGTMIKNDTIAAVDTAYCVRVRRLSCTCTISWQRGVRIPDTDEHGDVAPSQGLPSNTWPTHITPRSRDRGTQQASHSKRTWVLVVGVAALKAPHIRVAHGMHVLRAV